MAEPVTDQTKRPPDFRMEIIEKLGGLVDADAFTKGRTWLGTAIIEALAWVISKVLRVGVWIGVQLSGALVRGEDKAQDAFGQLAAVAIEDVFGVKVDPGAVNSRGDRGRRQGAANAIGRAMLDALTGGTPGAGATHLQPSSAGAEQFLTVVTQMALEGWLEGWLVEACTIGQMETFGELDDIMAQVLGLGRMTRAVTRPLMDARVITPFEWQVNRTYRPKLLGAGEVARQVARGRLTRDAAFEELARQGYSDERIEALLNAAAKFHSVSDLDLLVRSGQWTKGEAIQHLRDQGYDEGLAENEFTLEKIRRIATFERQIANAAADAYADGRISRGEMIGFLGGNTIDSQEGAQLAELADARRALRRRPLSSPEVRTLVKAGILSSIDYRRALEREGRDEEAIDALDLLLKHEIDEKREIDELRAEQEREREAERNARDEERAKARAAAEEARRLARRGREADLERAVIRGRIPIARYVEVIGQQFDPDTVSIMVADVEEQRQAYLVEQERKAAAEQRAAAKRIDIGSVRTAVLEGVLTVDEFRRHPSVQALDPADADILARTLTAELGDRAVAEQRKREAETRSKARGIDLGRYAQLVRRGIRSIEDYRARVAELFDSPADVDAVVELLEQELADAATERTARQDGEARTQTRGLSLEQFRRAVLGGDRTIAEFETFLQQQHFTVDAMQTLVAGVRRELAEVEAARARAEQLAPPVGSPDVSLSELERAARLGTISPSDFRAALAALGLDELDQEINVEQLLNQITAIQQARALRDSVEAEPGGRGLTLAELRAAVKAGIKSLEDYRAALIGAGKTPDAVQTLVALLEDEVAETKAAIERRRRIAERITKLGADLDTLEGEVLSGARSLDSYVQGLAAVGVLPAETGILVGLLVAQLETTTGATGG